MNHNWIFLIEILPVVCKMSDKNADTGAQVEKSWNF